MEHDVPLIAGAHRLQPARHNPWPARLDLAQSASGLVLALFMWGHMAFVSSILLGKDAMWTVTKFFEGYFFFGRSYPWIVSMVVASIIALLVVHALLAVRKFPINYRQFATFRGHMRMMRHEDTTLWFWQVLTGFALFFLASVHLYVMLTRPDRIGPFESADRVWSDHFWPLYIVLLLDGRGARRDRPLPPRGEMGLARGRRRECDTAQAEASRNGRSRRSSSSSALRRSRPMSRSASSTATVMASPMCRRTCSGASRVRRQPGVPAAPPR